MDRATHFFRPLIFFASMRSISLSPEQNFYNFLSYLLEPCFGNEKFTRELYFLYHFGSERRALRLHTQQASTPTITNFKTMANFVRRCPKNMSWCPKQFFSLFKLHKIVTIHTRPNPLWRDLVKIVRSDISKKQSKNHQARE